MQLKITITSLITSTVISQAAWIWADSPVAGSDPENTGASSLSFQGTVVSSPGGNDNVNGQGWDQPYAPITFIVTSNTPGTNISYEFSSATTNRLSINLDPDGPGGLSAAQDFTLQVIYPFGITARNVLNGSGDPIPGATGMASQLNDIPGSTADFALNSFDAAGNPLAIDLTNFSYLGSPMISGTTANFDNGNQVAFAANGATWSDGLPFSPYSDSSALGSQIIRVTDINLASGTVIPFSFDGGVSPSASAVTIPEPTSFSLIGLGIVGLISRRKR